MELKPIGLLRSCKSSINDGRDYLWSLYAARRDRKLFGGVSAYCMFIGHGRSGHSLTGALLNAHPNAVIAHELDALSYIDRGMKRDQLFSMLLKRDRWFAMRGCRWYEFDYTVPGQWQGRFRRLHVIGDKKGGISSTRLAQSPHLLQRLRVTVRLPLRIIHVTRNPFDNISTIARRENEHLDTSTRVYFELCATNERVIRECGRDEVVTIRHEEFVADPKRKLGELLAFLGLEPDEAYLRACASIVFESPSKSRHKHAWTPAQIKDVQAQIDRYSFLQGYTFDEARHESMGASSC